jgi:hypothetical protein
MFKKNLSRTLALALMASYALPNSGFATTKAINGNPSVFAAAVPMASMGCTGTPEQVAQFDKVDLPIMFTTSKYKPYSKQETLLHTEIVACDKQGILHGKNY